MAFSNPGAARGTLSGNIFAGTTTLGPSTAIQGLGDPFDFAEYAYDEYMGNETKDYESGENWASGTKAGKIDQCHFQGGSWNNLENKCDMPSGSGTGSGSVGPGSLTQDPALTCSQKGGTWNASTATCKPKATSGGGGGAVAPKPPTTPAPAAMDFSLSSITADPLVIGGAVVVALVGFVLYKKHTKSQRGY